MLIIGGQSCCSERPQHNGLTEMSGSSEKANAKVVHLEWSGSCSSRWGTGDLGSSSTGKELGKLRANSACQWCVLEVTKASLLADSSKEVQPNNWGGHYSSLLFRHLVKKWRGGDKKQKMLDGTRLLQNGTENLQNHCWRFSNSMDKNVQPLLTLKLALL